MLDAPGIRAARRQHEDRVVLVVIEVHGIPYVLAPLLSAARNLELERICHSEAEQLSGAVQCWSG